jgi:hypothetical protein
LGDVHFDGERRGYHWWNRLATGVEIDLTREQFKDGQLVTPKQVVVRPARVDRFADSGSTSCSASAS